MGKHSISSEDAKKLWMELKAAGYTQSKLSEETKLSTATVANISRGNCSKETAFKLSNLLNKMSAKSVHVISAQDELDLDVFKKSFLQLSLDKKRLLMNHMHIGITMLLHGDK